MATERLFFGWQRAALTTAAGHLTARFAAPGSLDLADVIVAVPGGRSERRLLEILVREGERRGLPVVPPRIVTVGALAEQLYEADRPFADSLVEQLAWARALSRIEPARLRQVVPAVPAENDLEARLVLGEMWARLHRELAGQGLKFAEVARAGAEVEGFREATRWQILADIQDEYLRALDEVELADQQMSRLLASKRGRVNREARVVLVGVVEMPAVLRQLFDRLPHPVTAMVFAPAELADRFDAYGCVRPEAWQGVPIELSDEQIEVVGDPADQATAAVRAIAALGGRYGAEEITIGVPDAEIVPYLQLKLEEHGVPSRYGAGVPMAETGVCRLLRAVAEYCQGRRFASLAALTRHPAVQTWLDRQASEAGWLAEMDDFYAEHLPHRLAAGWSPPARYRGLREAHRAIETLVGEFAGKPRPLDQWGESVLAVLATVYSVRALKRDVGPDRTILEACERVHATLCRHRSIPPSLMPEVTGTEALNLLLREVEADSVPPPAGEAAVEMIGWLELAMDDAPVLVVTGFNEGVVPGTLGADLFLPNRLRRALGIEDNDHRYARDAYVLTALAASCRHLTVIAGRRTAEGDPRAPSRLLFACDETTAARRVLRFLAEEEQSRPSPLEGEGLGVRGTGPTDSESSPPCGTSPLTPTLSRQPKGSSGATILSPLGKGSSWAIDVPLPQPLAEPVTSMRVTEFRDYLACPYRYYLRHRLKLESQSDSAEELDGAAFGSLAHEVLCQFGRDEISQSTDAEKIRAWLSDALNRTAADRYGKTPLPAVYVQIEQLRLRLDAFARWQAGWAREGWRIEHAEYCPEAEAAIVVDGRPMGLRGRIDRIDVHPSGKRMLLDYKTSDAARAPDQTHRQDGQWIDLQLPLYRRLLPGPGKEGEVQLGYLVLPKDTSGVGLLQAEWTEAELREADEVAAHVVRQVRAEVFWPPTTPPPAGFEDLAAICHDDQLVAAMGTDEGGDGP